MIRGLLICTLLLCSAVASIPTHACSTSAAAVNLGSTNSLSLRTTQ